MSYDSQFCPIERDEKSCRTCRHYDAADNRVQDSHGTCRRHAPQPRLTTEERPKDVYFVDWPLVSSGDYCGDWVWDESIEESIDAPKENPRA
jgi:hypothetical protein